MKLQLLPVLVSLLVSGPLYIHGYCPDGQQVAQQLTACLSQFTSLTDFSKGPITASQFNNYCTSSARETEIQCAENIINDCIQGSSTTRRIIDKVINICAIRGSVKILCNNTKVFAEKQDCIGRYQNKAKSCFSQEYVSYNAKIRAHQSEALSKGAEWLEEKVYEELCDYVGEVADCQRPYGKNCGRQIGDVFDALIHAATPPVCAGVIEHVNLMLLLFLVFMAVVKGKL